MGDGRRSGPTIAEAAGRATRFTDHGVPDPGIREIFATSSVWQVWLDVEVALARAEAQVGIVPQAAADAIAAAGRLDALDPARIVAALRTQSHPLTPLITGLVRVVGPAAGGWVHWGATSQNIMQSGYAVLVARAHRVIVDLLDDCLAALADLADRGADLLMPGRTHGQHAVPITFGLKCATWIEEFLRARERLEDSVRPCRRAMVGGAVGSFASLGDAGPRVQALVARELGLDPMPVPSRTVLDPLAGYLSDVALASASGAHVAVDIETMMQTEFGEVSEPVPEGSIGSSTMPHKRNPKLCADVLDLSGEIRGIAPTAVAAIIHPHEADSGATAHVDGAVERGLVAMGDLLVRLRMILEGLELFPARMRRNLDLSGDLIGSEAVMLALADEIGRDQAHRIVYDLAMRATRTGERFAGLLEGDARVSAHLTPARIKEVLDPAAHVGLSPVLAREAAERARRHLADVAGR